MRSSTENKKIWEEVNNVIKAFNAKYGLSDVSLDEKTSQDVEAEAKKKEEID